LLSFEFIVQPVSPRKTRNLATYKQFVSTFNEQMNKQGCLYYLDRNTFILHFQVIFTVV